MNQIDLTQKGKQWTTDPGQPLRLPPEDPNVKAFQPCTINVKQTEISLQLGYDYVVIIAANVDDGTVSGKRCFSL